MDWHFPLCIIIKIVSLIYQQLVSYQIFVWFVLLPYVYNTPNYGMKNPGFLASVCHNYLKLHSIENCL